MISSLYWPYLVADYYHALEITSAVVAVIILALILDLLLVGLGRITTPRGIRV